MTDDPDILVVGNRIDDLELVYEGLDRFCARQAVPENGRRSLMLVVEELFSNTVNYGYSENQSDKIEISLDIVDGEIALAIRDRAVAFDSSAPPNIPDASDPVEEMKIGGLGLYLVHQFAKSITSQRIGDINLTEIRLPLNGEV